MLLLLLSISICKVALAQNNRNENFQELLKKAEILWEKEAFEEAFDKLNAAREAFPEKNTEINLQYTKFIGKIAKQYDAARKSAEVAERNEQIAKKQAKNASDQAKIAEQKSKEALNQKKIAEEALKIAKRSAFISDSLSIASSIAARRAYANELANQSKIALEKGDRSTAFRLVDFAYRFVDSTNIKVKSSLLELLHNYNNFFSWKVTLPGFYKTVKCFTMSTNNKVAICTEERFVEIWNINTAKLVAKFQAHSDEILCATFSSNNKYLATGSKDKTIKIWDAFTGELVVEFKGHTGSVSSLAFSFDGKKLVSGSYDNTVRLWSIEEKKNVHTFKGHDNRVNSVSFSADAKKIASGSADASVKIWDVNKMQLLFTFRRGLDVVNSLSFSSKDKDVLIVGVRNKPAKLYELDAKQDKPTDIEASYDVQEILFKADGKNFFLIEKDKVTSWDLKPLKLVKNFNDELPINNKVAISVNGDRIIAKDENNSISVWETTEEGEDIRYIKNTVEVNHAALSPDSKLIATAGADGIIKLWNAATSQFFLNLEGHNSPVYKVVFSPDGTLLASGAFDGKCIIWDIKTLKAIHTFSAHSTAINTIAFSRNNKLLATSANDNTVRIYDITSGIEKSTQYFTASISSILFATDHATLFAVDKNYQIHAWETTTSKPVRIEGLTTCLSNIASSTKGQYLAYSSIDKNIKIINLSSGKAISTVFSDGKNYKYISMAPSGRDLACANDSEIVIYDMVQNKKIFSTQIHKGVITSLAYSEDGNKLITTSFKDKTAKIWPLTIESWKETIGKTKIINALDYRQLLYYNLEDLLDQDPNNESKLIESKDAGQIAAFADLYAEKIRNASFSSKTDYERALRLYSACLDQGKDHEIFQEKVAVLKKMWNEKTK